MTEYPVLILCRKCDGLLAEATAYDTNIAEAKYICEKCGDMGHWAIAAASMRGQKIKGNKK